MSDKMNVTLDEQNKTIGIVIGNALGIHRTIKIDLADGASIVSGVIQAANAGDQMIQAQLALLTQKVEALERLAKNDKAVGTTL